MAPLADPHEGLLEPGQAEQHLVVKSFLLFGAGERLSLQARAVRCRPTLGDR